MLHALVLTMLVGQAPVAPAAAARPAWVGALPEVPGRLYALGTADLGANEGQAITRASDRARLEVVSRLRTSVKGQTSVATRTAELQRGGSAAGYGERQVRDTVSVSAQAEDLPGLVVERTYADPVGRSAYALAYLDLAQAQSALAGSLAQVQERRSGVGEEVSRKARWRLRRVKADLDRLDETMGLLALTGVGQDLRPKALAERTAVEARLAALDKADLPPLDFAKLTVGFRSNVELPLGIEAYLKAQIGLCGLVPRDLSPDLLLDLTFSGGDGGPEFIFTAVDVYRGLSYRLDVQMRLLEQGGVAFGRPVPIQIIQSASPEGMVNEFRRQFERRLPTLFAAFQSELQ